MIIYIPIVLLGALIAVFGIINMTGNISTLHSYHRHRVREEDRVPFGRIVGSGTLIVGIGVALYGVLMMVYDCTAAEFLIPVGVVLLCVGCVVGLALSFWGMIKYNKGIF